MNEMRNAHGWSFIWFCRILSQPNTARPEWLLFFHGLFDPSTTWTSFFQSLYRNCHFFDQKITGSPDLPLLADELPFQACHVF